MGSGNLTLDAATLAALLTTLIMAVVVPFFTTYHGTKHILKGMSAEQRDCLGPMIAGIASGLSVWLLNPGMDTRALLLSSLAVWAGTYARQQGQKRAAESDTATPAAYTQPTEHPDG